MMKRTPCYPEILDFYLDCTNLLGFWIIFYGKIVSVFYVGRGGGTICTNIWMTKGTVCDRALKSSSVSILLVTVPPKFR